MPYRIFAALIVGFWLVMSALLFRLEVHPEKSTLLDVPVSHVLKLMFVQAQPSNLNIVVGGQHMGSLSIRPNTTADKQTRSVAFAGNLSLQLPMMSRQRVAWDGTLDLDRAFEMTALKFSVLVRESGYTTEFIIDPRAHRVSYRMLQRGRFITQSSLPLDSDGASSALLQLGIDPTILANLRENFASLASPTMTAKQSELKIRNEKIDAYQLTVRQGDAVIADIYVSQLGQILLAKTPLGFTLSSEDISF